MKRLQAYFSFTRVERFANIVLITVLLILGTLALSMDRFVNIPPRLAANDRELAASWAAFSARNSGNVTESHTVSASGPVAAATLFPFDPNTIDSADFLKLGVNLRAVKGLMNWRRHNKKFYKKEDLKPLYNLSPEEYARIEPFITISVEMQSRPGFQPFTRNVLPPLPAVIDLNTTDSATIVRLNGIGPTLAHKIIAKRNELGGFVNHKQLLDIYRFPDTTFKMLQQRLSIDTKKVQFMDLNTVTLEQLKAQPLIGEKMGKNILLYRDGLKRFKNVEELRQAPLMSEEIYRKIAPYFIVH